MSPTSPTDIVSASARVNDLAVAPGGLAAPFNLGATSVQSTSTVAGPCGSLLTAAGTTIENGTFTFAGVTQVIPVNPAPNTVFFDQAGIRVVLNEQIVGGDGTSARSLTVNAIHVTLTSAALAGGGALTGDIIIADSQAQLSCGPALPADISIIGTSNPNPGTVGQPLTKTLTVTNSGPGIATNVVVTDTLPAGLAFVSATASQGTCAFTSGTVTCSLGALAPGATATVTIVVTPTVTGNFSNPVTATSDVADPSTADNTINVTGTIGDGDAKKDDDDDDRRKLTEEEQQQEERTNRLNLDNWDIHGHVVGVRCQQSDPVPDAATGQVPFNPDDTPYALIHTVDSPPAMQVRLYYDTRTQCRSIQVGDYLEVDGEKQHEWLFDAENVSIRRGGQRVR